MLIYWPYLARNFCPPTVPYTNGLDTGPRTWYNESMTQDWFDIVGATPIGYVEGDFGLVPVPITVEELYGEIVIGDIEKIGDPE